MSFSYPFTCNDIDRQIEKCKDILENSLYSYLKDSISILDHYALEKISKNLANDLYKDIEDCFEIVRNSNEDIRSSATHQIEELETKNDNLQYEIQQLQKEFERLGSL